MRILLVLLLVGCSEGVEQPRVDCSRTGETQVELVPKGLAMAPFSPSLGATRQITKYEYTCTNGKTYWSQF